MRGGPGGDDDRPLPLIGESCAIALPITHDAIAAVTAHKTFSDIAALPILRTITSLLPR
jgi:hypothetical protein